MKWLMMIVGLWCASVPAWAEKSVVVGIPAQENDPFWKIVLKGCKDAASKHDISLDLIFYSSADEYEEMNSIDKALSKPADATVFSIHHQTPALMHALDRANLGTGLVQIINSGEAAVVKSGIKANFIGMNDYQAGIMMGRGFSNLHVEQVLFVTHLPTDDMVTIARMAGLKAALPFAKIQMLDISDIPSNKAPAAVSEAIEKNKALDTIVALSVHSLDAISEALDLGNSNGTPFKIATYDLSKHTADLIKSDKVLFTIDQHPYLQGYYAVVNASLNSDYQLYPNGSVMTGPTIIFAQDIDPIYEHIGVTR